MIPKTDVLHKWLEGEGWPDVVYVSEEDFEWLKKNVGLDCDSHDCVTFVATEFRRKPKTKLILDMSGRTLFAEVKKE